MCNANKTHVVDYVGTFPPTLYGPTINWWQSQQQVDYWNALKDAFLANFCSLEYTESLQKRLRTIFMKLKETYISYYTQMQDILKRWANHQMLESYLTRLFIGGLYPPILKTYVKKQAPANVNCALDCIKR